MDGKNYDEFIQRYGEDVDLIASVLRQGEMDMSSLSYEDLVAVCRIALNARLTYQTDPLVIRDGLKAAIALDHDAEVEEEVEDVSSS